MEKKVLRVRVHVLWGCWWIDFVTCGQKQNTRMNSLTHCKTVKISFLFKGSLAKYSVCGNDNFSLFAFHYTNSLSNVLCFVSFISSSVTYSVEGEKR